MKDGGRDKGGRRWGGGWEQRGGCLINWPEDVTGSLLMLVTITYCVEHI